MSCSRLWHPSQKKYIKVFSVLTSVDRKSVQRQTGFQKHWCISLFSHRFSHLSRVSSISVITHCGLSHPDLAGGSDLLCERPQVLPTFIKQNFRMNFAILAEVMTFKGQSVSKSKDNWIDASSTNPFCFYHMVVLWSNSMWSIACPWTMLLFLLVWLPWGSLWTIYHLV